MSEPYTRKIIVVCPAVVQAAANAWVAANLDPEGGHDTFNVPAFDADGNLAAYVVAPLVTDATYDLVVPVIAELGGTLFDAEATTYGEHLASLGLHIGRPAWAIS